MEFFGKPPINPLLFYSGKISGYITWVAFVYSLRYNHLIDHHEFYFTNIIAYCMFALGLGITIICLFHLGKSIRFGLPTERTVLNTADIYRFSRNPIYFSLGLFTIASMLYTLNFVITVPGMFSLVVYHLIIRSEEKFLQSWFGNDYKTHIIH